MRRWMSVWIVGCVVMWTMAAVGQEASVAAGSLSSCVVKGGEAWCWGSNEGGELGANSDADKSSQALRVQTPDKALEGVAQLELEGHGCAVVTGGEVWCWGLGRFGQLGRGEREGTRWPVQVDVGGEAAQVSTGGEHTCVVMASGAVKCWGANKSGQLGNGTTTDSAEPVVVQGLLDAAQVSCGGGAEGRGHCCAVRAGGRVVCWGANGLGQLGNGKEGKDSARPVDVSKLKDAEQVTVGREHSCAVRQGGKISCWGGNVFGGLGGKGHKDRSRPKSVRGLDGDAVGVSAGAHHTCALMEKGGVMCWGDNNFGQVGSGSEEPIQLGAVSVVGIADAVGLASGWDHSCALLKGGAVVCWGDNAYGQLGNGSSGGNSRVPVNVEGLP